ncbi:MAG: hypothetical protein AB8B85_13270 [Paracoccaceae bacterium]
MTTRTGRLLTPEYQDHAVAGLAEPRVTYAGLSAEFSVVSSHLNTWHLEV